MNKSLTALAKGLQDGGCQYTTNFPGFNSHILFNLLGGKKISPNEKIAYEMAFGASLAGKRSVVSLKNFGLNVAADSFLNSIVSGVNAGLVLVVFDDMEVEGSQARQDSRHYRDFFGGLWFEPNSLQEAYTIGYHSFSWSEALDIPIVIRLTNQFFKLSGKFKKNSLIKHAKIPIASSRKKYLVHPVNSQEQRTLLKKKKINIDRFVNFYYSQKSELSKKTVTQGIIVFGNCQKELYNYIDQQQEILEITTYPLPFYVLNEFFKGKKQIIILEQGNSYGADLIKKQFVSRCRGINIISDTGIIPNFDKHYIRWSKLSTLFEALKSISPSFVVSDLTQFTAEISETTQACLCLGSCISIGIGLAESGVEYPFCVSGDASLVHTGERIILEAKERNTPIGIIIIDNGGSCSTGGQMALGGMSLNNIDVPQHHVIYSNTTKFEFIQLLKKMKTSNRLSILKITV